MTATQILEWARVGTQLISILGVPIQAVIALVRSSGGTDAEAELLVQHWASVTASIEARVQVLKQTDLA